DGRAPGQLAVFLHYAHVEIVFTCAEILVRVFEGRFFHAGAGGVYELAVLHYVDLLDRARADGAHAQLRRDVGVEAVAHDVGRIARSGAEIENDVIGRP